MDMSHTSGNYAWNDSNVRHMKYESCSPTNTNTDTTQSPPTLLPISLGATSVTIPHHSLVGISHTHRHPYHHLTAATLSTYNSGGDNNSCSGATSGDNGNNNSVRVDSPLLVGSSQQLNFATNNNEDMDCGEATVAAYVAGGGLVAYRGGIGGLNGRGVGGVGASVGGNIGIGSSNRVSRQDPLSHRIIEKRRRDRMNNCLADLSRLIPAEYLKKGRGRVEKTEIIEMAIMHMKYLQHMNHYSLGYQDCMSETLRFLVEVEGQFPRSPLCVRLLAHLQQHRDAVCVRRGSGGSTSSTSHSPVGGGSNSMGGEGAMAAMVLAGDGTSGGGNGMTMTPTPTPTPTPSCHLPPLSSPTSPVPSNHQHLPTSPNTTCTKPPSSSTPHPCILKPPKLEPNNNEEDYHSNNQQTNSCHGQHSHGTLSPTSGGLEEDGDCCSTLDETEDGKGNENNGEGLIALSHHDHHRRHDEMDGDSKCSLQQRVHQIQLERHERHSEGYKYKNDIKLRFTQDVIGSTRRDSNGSTGNHSSVSPPLHHHSDMCPQSPKLHSHVTTMPNLRSYNNDLIDVKDMPFAVPIFALHNKGTFYVPLTVDYRALLPYLSGTDLTTWPKDVILHPVAINVNFQTRKGHG